mgnify:CR=1 FL=1
MSWLTRILPKISAKSNEGTEKRKSPIPAGLWVKCPNCEQVLYQSELKDSIRVCPKCGYHMRLSARERLKAFLDWKGTHEEIGAEVRPTNPLNFVDSKPYPARVAAAQAKTDETDALVVMRGELRKEPIVAAAFEFDFMGGSMGSVVGERFVLGVERALRERIPFVTFASSGGARMQEGLLSLMQMAKTNAAVGLLGEARIPYVSVLTDPTMGGVSASFAFMGDVVIAEPHAFTGFAGHRQLCQPGRYHAGRARGTHRLCRPPRHRADGAGKIAGGLSEGGDASRKRRRRHDRGPSGVASGYCRTRCASRQKSDACRIKYEFSKAPIHREKTIMIARGSLTAIVTPMKDDESVDFDAYKKLINWQIEAGTDGIVSMGTTGESPTLSIDEHNAVVECAVKSAAGRVPVIAGTGGNSTTEAIELTRFAKKVGADASLQVVPYYNKPTQEGLYQHFKAITEAVDIPVILYNVPGRTVADLKNDTVLRLAKLPSIVGLKDATGDLARAIDLIRRLPAATGGRDFAVYSGNDDSALALMLVGGAGVISVTANLLPKEMHQMAAAALSGDIKTARALNDRLMPLHQKLFVEPNPVAPKWALYRMGLIGKAIRLPLTLLSEANQQVVEAAMREAGMKL